jgi:hypothetical protein
LVDRFNMAGQAMDMPPEQVASIQYQLQHLNDDRRPVVNGACWALWGLAVVAMGLRFYAKRITQSGFKLEDTLLLLGMVCCAPRKQGSLVKLMAFPAWCNRMCNEHFDW